MTSKTSRETAPAAADQTAPSSVATAFRQAARRVTDFFAIKKGIKLRHADALELVAVVHGARNWQTLLSSAQAKEADIAAGSRPPVAWTGHAITTGDVDARHEWLAQQLASNVYACRPSLTVVESADELEAIDRLLGKNGPVHFLPVSRLLKFVGHPSVLVEHEELMSLAEDMNCEGQWVVSLVGAGTATRKAAQEALTRLYQAIFQFRRENARFRNTPFIVTTHSGEGLQPIFEQGRSVNMCAVALYRDGQHLHRHHLDNARNLTVLQRHALSRPSQLG